MHVGRATTRAPPDSDLEGEENVVTIAKVWGVPIVVNPSWLVIFAIFTWSFATGDFPAAYPGWHAVTRWVVAAILALLAFASVLVHELGHSWVALRHGLPIRRITLFVFGGVAEIGREAATPAAEVRIAVAGPLTSLALAACFGLVGLVARDVDVVAAPAGWLVRINATVAIFNLMPGFPLDGGRVLRAIAWRRTGSFEEATRTAAFSGRVVGIGLILLGLLMLLAGNLSGGVWVAAIGWFLDNAARQTGHEVRTGSLLRGVSVAQVMGDECRRVSPGLKLDQLVDTEVLGAGRRCFFVVDHDRLSGLLTLADIKGIPRERWSVTSVQDAMTPLVKLRSVGSRDDALTALRTMDEADVAQLPVLEDGRLIGAVGREQVLRYIAARSELGV
jgi:Zn-dependent protease